MISILRMTPFTLWTTGGDFLRQGKILESLAKVLGACGSGPLPSGYQCPKADPTPIRFRSTSPNRLLVTARVRTGYYGNGKQVKNCTVSSAITAVGQTIALACDSNPTKVVGSECLLPRLQIMLDRYRKVDLSTRKKLPVQSCPRTPCRNSVPTRNNSMPAGKCGSDNDCLLLPTPGR